MRTMLFLSACALALAAGNGDMPFTGTWRVDINKMEAPKKPVRIEIAKGMYKCLTCDPKLEVQADGQEHAIAGHPGFDAMTVKLTGDKIVETMSKKAGRITSKAKIVVSSDGNRAVNEFTSYPPSGGPPVTGKAALKRSGSPEPGMHLANGSWLMDKVESISENGKEVSIEQSAGGFAMKDPTGFSYNAKFDGKDYPVHGDNSFDTVQVKLINPHTVEEIYKYKGKVKTTNRLTVAGDGRTMTVEWKDSRGFSGKDVMEKK